MKNFTKMNRNFFHKIVVILFAVIGLSVSVGAQTNRTVSNEFIIFGGGSYSFMYYQKTLPGAYGASSIGFGADLGAGFTGFVSNNIGFHVGCGFGMYQVKALVDSFTFVTPQFDNAFSLFGEDQPYDLYTNLYNYDETHKIYFLTIPMMIQFQTMPRRSNNAGRDIKFYVMTGVKLNILFKRQYEVEVQELKNMAYFTQLDNWAGTQRFAGLGRFKGNTSNGLLKNIMPVFTFEAGAKWDSSPRTFFYTGVFFNCGLSDPTKSGRKSANNYTSGERLADLSLLEFYNKSYLMEIGIKLRLAIVGKPRGWYCR
jgi:hypothetical protein